MLTPSRYNVRASAAEPDGRVVWANTRSGATARVDSEVDAFLRGETATTPVLAELAAAGLVAEGDERAALLAEHRLAREDDALALTIAPTVACNLRCEYCYETEHPARRMDDGELDALVAMVRRRLAHDPPSRFTVTWFGGEPLLHLAGIESLSRRFVALASFAGVPYSASIVTNATRMTPDVARRLRENRVLRAQVTLDGAQRTHDLLRVDGRGRGTYEEVLAGIAAARGVLGVDVRIHVDARTARSIPGLLEDLAARGLTDVTPYFARIEPPGVFGDAGPVPSRHLTGEQFARLEVGWLAQAAALGFDAHQPVATDHGPTPCAAVLPGHFAVEPGGRLNRCYADVADDRRRVGTLLADGTVELGDEEELWRAALPFDLGCADCTYLPLCVGGCPKARVHGALHPDLDERERLAFKEGHVCHVRKFNLPDLLAAGLAS